MTFQSVGNVIIPTDFHSIIFQRGGEKPPTSVWDIQPLLDYQKDICCYLIFSGHPSNVRRPHEF